MHYAYGPYNYKGSLKGFYPNKEFLLGVFLGYPKIETSTQHPLWFFP